MVILPQADSGKSRDKIGEHVGLSGRTIDKFHTIATTLPDVIATRFGHAGRGTDPWLVACDANIVRRHLTVGEKAMFGLAWEESEKTEAKKRQQDHGGTAPGKPKSLEVVLPQVIREPQSRDKLGQRVGVGGSSIDKARTIADTLPDVAASVASGKTTLEAGYKLARAKERDLISIAARSARSSRRRPSLACRSQASRRRR